MKIEINSRQTKSFYDLIEKNSEFLIKSIEAVEEYSEKKKYLNPYLEHITEHLPKIEYEALKKIKNKTVHATTILCTALIWAFNETSKYKHTTKNNAFEHDSYSIVNEIYDFIEMFKIWALANDENIPILKISKKETNSYIYRLITILIHKKIIKTESTYIRSQNKKKICYYCEKFKKTKIIKIHTKALEYKKVRNEYILLGEHYSVSWRLFINNPNNNSNFKITEDEIIKIMTKMFTNIDFEHYAEIVKLYCTEHEIEISKIEEEYETYLKEYKKVNREGNQNLIKEISKKLSIYQKGIELKEILSIKFDQDEDFFIPWNYDFRGRTYYLSDINFTFNKEFRWCMYKGWYEEEEDFIPKWHTYNHRIYKTLEKNEHLLKELKIEIKTENPFIKQTLIWLLISAGEINKAKLGKKVHISQFIEEGVKILNNYEDTFKKLNYNDKIKIHTIAKMIKECAEGLQWNRIRKRLISKDAPASVFQHLVLNFGWKDDEMLKRVNLMSEDIWYDIYTFFADEWKEKKIKNINEEENFKEILKFFNRNSLKKVIMTSNYGVGHESAENYFKEIIHKIEPQEIEETRAFIKKNWKTIQKLFKDFFEFISELSLLQHSPEEIIKYIEEHEGIIELVDATIDINYFKKEKYTIDIQHEGSRYTKTFNAISREKDKKKFETAARANFIHSLDAALTRWVIRKYGIYTIHDCFLIDIANITFLVSLINEGMGKKFHSFHKTWKKEEKEIFSIFIVI